MALSPDLKDPQPARPPTGARASRPKRPEDERVSNGEQVMQEPPDLGGGDRVLPGGKNRSGQGGESA